jgi:hypothetical protein
MEVQFTLEQEARLGQIASVQGVAPARLVQDAALLLIEDDERPRVRLSCALRWEWSRGEDPWRGGRGER